jgi:hypothetical protein
MSDVIEIPGGYLRRVVTLDPRGRYYVVCNKHPVRYVNEVYFSDTVFTLLHKGEIETIMKRTAVEALRQCPWCLEEEKKSFKEEHKKSRFPEGSEL